MELYVCILLYCVMCLCCFTLGLYMSLVVLLRAARDVKFKGDVFGDEMGARARVVFFVIIFYVIFCSHCFQQQTPQIWVKYGVDQRK
jgi:hypothetical protein